MKKILFALTLIFMISSASFAASEEDIYVRKDVFDAKMEALFERMDKRFDRLDAKIDKNYVELSARMDRLEGKMEGFEYKLEAVNDTIAYRLSLLTLAVAIVGLFFAFFAWRNSNANVTMPSLTREDVVKIFEELMKSHFQDSLNTSAVLGR